jgi:hypothetical protein
MENSTQNSFSELIDKYILLQNNALSIIQKINEAVVSDNEEIVFTLKDMNNSDVTYQFPSFGFLKESLDRVDTTLKSLMGLEDGETIMKMADGTYRRIITAKLSKNPNDIVSLSVPKNFDFKPNWFFESFLSPSLHVNVDVSKYVSQISKKILCKRVILVTDSIEKESYFDTLIKGRNDILLDTLVSDLSKNGIVYYEDEEVKDLPISVIQYGGEFDVIDVKDIQTTNLDGVSKTSRQYFLNKLTYDNAISGVADSEELKIGNKIISNDTIYEIISVDSSINVISLKRLSGYDPITIGANSIKIYSDVYAPKTAEIGIGFNERQVIFFKAVEESSNTVSINWSYGIAIFTNDLSIVTTEGEKNLKTFYGESVLDFSKSILAIAKEKTVPSIYGEIPDTPSVNLNNFKVVQINTHKFDSNEQEEIKKKASNKIVLANEIKQLEAAIEKNKQILGNTVFNTEQEKTTVKNTINSLITEKNSKSALYTSTVSELTAIARSNNITSDTPKYRIRGFFDIPNPKYNDYTGDQEVIQFEYSYRYLRIDNKPATANQLDYTSSNEQIKRGTFSPWNSIKSDIRKRYYDSTVGYYKWEVEDTENADKININQIDIPISPGEKVELKIKSYSEAGWPINPLESDWSESLIVEFPQDLVVNDTVVVALSQALSEETQVKFEDTLRSKNLDLHLQSSNQTGDKYFSHDSESIISGFYKEGGIILNLYEKLKDFDNQIKELQNKILQKVGKLKVSVIDETTGGKTSIQNNSILELSAGYYTDEIALLASAERKGAIITKVYKLVIENSENAILELMSMFPGGADEKLPTETTMLTPQDTNYLTKLKYWKTPVNNIGVSSAEIKNSNGSFSENLASRQLMSQFMYVREKNVGLVNQLYKEPADINDRSFVPIDSGAPVATLWNFSFTGNTPNGNGKANGLFSVHIDCPILYANNETDWDWTSNPSYINLQQPLIYGDTNAYPIAGCKASAFRHSKYFNLQTSETDGLCQLNYRDPWYYNTDGSEKPMNSADFLGIWNPIDKYYRPNIIEFPEKIGFYPHDRYLCGTNTCGSYLFVAPAFFDQLLVDGTDYLATKEIQYGEDNAIVIPLIFQYRMSDYYGSGNIAGDTSGLIKNVSYTKQIGLDIFVKNQTKFSFDIKVNAKYKKTTTTEI